MYSLSLYFHVFTLYNDFHVEPIKEGTGRIVRFDLQPLDKLNRPRIDVLASMSGIFRDSFANVVDAIN